MGGVNAYSRYLTHVHANGNDAMYNITPIEGTSRPLRSRACTGNVQDCHLGSDRQHLQYHLSSKTASKQLNTSQGADDSPLSTLLSLVATSLIHSLQRSPLAAIGSRYSWSALYNHIRWYCYVSAYASHTSFFCAFCNLIGGTRKSDPAQNPNSSYTRPFSSHGVVQSRERGWLARLFENQYSPILCVVILRWVSNVIVFHALQHIKNNSNMSVALLSSKVQQK